MKLKKLLLISIVLIIVGTISVNANVLKRGENYNIYKNADGTATATISTRPVNYFDGLEYKPIETKIISSSGGYDYEVTQGIYQAYFKEKSESSPPWLSPILMIKDGYAISLSPESLKFRGQTNPHKQQSIATINNNVITYTDQFKNIDLKYNYTPTALKEELIIDNINDLRDIKSDPNLEDDLILKFSVRSYNIDSNISMDMKINGNKVDFADIPETETSDAIYFLDENNETVYYFEKPVAYDSEENKINLNYYISSNVHGNLVVKIVIPYDWLVKAIYPVYIDPTVSYLQVFPPYGIKRADPEDCYYMGYASGTPPGSYGYYLGRTTLGCGSACGTCPPGTYQMDDRGGSRWDISFIPFVSSVDSLKITFDWEMATCCGDGTVGEYIYFKDVRSYRAPEESSGYWNDVGNGFIYNTFNVTSDSGTTTVVLSSQARTDLETDINNDEDYFLVGASIPSSECANCGLLKFLNAYLNITYTINLTLNPAMFVNDVEVWNYSGHFLGEETVNFTQELNSALQNCTPDENNYCDIPLVFHSDEGGILKINNINIYFNITEYMWNVTDLAELSTYRVRVKATDGLLNSSWDESDDDFTIDHKSAIGIDLIYPTQDINVTKNEFFNFTTEVCCFESDCDEVNVSLDPEKSEYTPSTYTKCSGKTCTKTFYSGIRFVYENSRWKKVEEARSLMGILDVIIDKDPYFPVAVIDFNYSSITLDLTALDEKLNKILDLKVYNKHNRSEKPKDEYGNIKDKDKGIVIYNNGEIVRETIDLSDTVENILGIEIKWGDASTTIKLQEPDTENLEDAFFDEDDTRTGTEALIIADVLDGHGAVTFVKFNMSSIPSDMMIEDATLCLYTSTTGTASDEDLDMWYVENQSWKEEEIDDLCNDGAVCDEVFDMFTTKIRTYNGLDGVIHWDCIDNLQSAVQTEIDNGNINLSFALNNSGTDASDSYQWKSKEWPTALNRPYLNITYTIEGEKGLISTTEGAKPFYTNGTNPTSISLNKDECQNVTWWVNATGNIGNTYTFFSYANKTSDMSISNKTNEINITIQAQQIQSELLTNLTEIHQDGNLRVFRFIIQNVPGLTSGFTWELNTGESTIESTESISLNTNETAFTYAEYNYASGGNYDVTATVYSGDYFDSETINIEV
ncbi:MAG: DNRLRE domain-containing protein [Candidatus Woesearchaeota archaeon]